MKTCKLDSKFKERRDRIVISSRKKCWQLEQISILHKTKMSHCLYDCSCWFLFHLPCGKVIWLDGKCNVSRGKKHRKAPTTKPSLFASVSQTWNDLGHGLNVGKVGQHFLGLWVECNDCAVRNWGIIRKNLGIDHLFNYFLDMESILWLSASFFRTEEWYPSKMLDVVHDGPSMISDDSCCVQKINVKLQWYINHI